MRARTAGLIAILLLLICPGVRAQATNAAPSDECLTNQVLDEECVDTATGSVTDSVATASQQNGLIQRLQSEDVIEKVTRLGLPFVLEADSPSVGTSDTTEEPLLKSLSFQASQLTALHNWRSGGGSRSIPVDIGTQMDWDMETESYEFSNVKLELLDDHIWIVRDWREDSDEEWNMGIQFKKTW